MQASDLRAWRRPFALLDRCGGWSADLSLRLFLAWEFFESGWEKWNGENWFGDIQSAFPFPFDRLPAAFNWELSLWAELLGALFLLLGLGTRLTALVLIVVTLVATAAVHWPAEWSSLAELARGYSITDHGFGNFKLPAIYLAALLPLLLAEREAEPGPLARTAPGPVPLGFGQPRKTPERDRLRGFHSKPEPSHHRRANSANGAIRRYTGPTRRITASGYPPYTKTVPPTTWGG